MATFETFRPYVQLVAPAAPNAIIDDMVLDGARTFCFDTWRLREDKTVTTVDGTMSYTITPTSGRELIAVGSVEYDGGELSPATRSLLLRYNTDEGTPTNYWVDGNVIYFYLIPDDAYTIHVECIERPTQSATSLPDALLEFREAIVAWARYRMLSMPGKPWSSPDAAAVALKEYVHYAGKERVRDMKTQTSASLTVQMRPLA